MAIFDQPLGPDAGSSCQFERLINRLEPLECLNQLNDVVEPELIDFRAAIVAVQPVEPLVILRGARPVVRDLILNDARGIRSHELSVLVQYVRHQIRDLRRPLGDPYTGRFERGHLLDRRAATARDDRSGVPHLLARRRGASGDEPDDRLGDVLLDELRRDLFVGAADLADHDDRFGGRIILEEGEDVDERRADDRVATDSDRGRLADASLGQRVDDFVGQRATARDQPDRPARLANDSPA